MSNQEVTNPALEKLKQRFGDVSRTGGKGSQRIVKKTNIKTNTENKSINEVVSKLQAQQLPDVQEVIMYTEDDQVITLNNPKCHASF